MKKVLVLSLALILLLGITSHGTSSYFSDTETSSGNTFTAWVEECVCYKFNVSNDGGKPETNRVFMYDASGNPRYSFQLAAANQYPSGVAAVGDYIYVLDQSDKRVYKYDCCGAYVERSRILNYDGSSIANPKGLAIDIAANEMWVVSDTDKEIYQYSLSAAFPDTGTPLPASPDAIPLDTNQQKVAGLAIDSSFLYVLDYDNPSKETRFYRYLKADGSVTVSKVLLDGGDPLVEDDGIPLANPSGAMIDGTSIWVVDRGTGMMYEYNLTELFDGIGTTLDAASEFPLDSANNKASGV